MTYKKISEGHFLSDKIENKELFPVGGTFVGKTDLFTQVDADSFQDFFKVVADSQKMLENNTALKEWYSKINTDLDYSLFCHMYAFNPTFNKFYENALIKNNKEHTDFYVGGTPKKLSEALYAKKCMCTEPALLAQLYFQSQHIPTRYVTGELVSNGNFDDFEAHSFVVFQNHRKKYVYDPANQLDSQLPRVAEFVGKKDNAYLKTVGLFTLDKWFYSGGDKGEFLRDLPIAKTLRKRLMKNSKKTNIKKGKINV